MPWLKSFSFEEIRPFLDTKFINRGLRSWDIYKSSKILKSITITIEGHNDISYIFVDSHLSDSHIYKSLKQKRKKKFRKVALISI